MSKWLLRSVHIHIQYKLRLIPRCVNFVTDDKIRTRINACLFRVVKLELANVLTDYMYHAY